MSRLAEIRAEAARLRQRFQDAGAQPVECDVLQPADTLLDLYGEDIRARAYVVTDPVRGELMLRPDFTVPVLQAHMEAGGGAARYTYAGEVFRRQEDHPERRSEYMQVGYEILGARTDPAAAPALRAEEDAEVFSRFHQELSGLGLRAAVGDIGLLTAAVMGLRTTDRRKAALMRHIWRPRRFRALLDRFSGRVPPPASRTALLAAADPFAAAPEQIGLRSRAEVEARIALLREDAREAPLSQEEVVLIDALLAVRAALPHALERLQDIAVDLPSTARGVSGLKRRCAAIERHGIDLSDIAFEASYGRTTLEYYDGFVFGFSDVTRPDLPPVATGGRYDALTRRLGGTEPFAAVGGAMRPAILLELRSTRA